MATRGYFLLVAAGTVGLSAGCVDRRYLVETNVPGAQITVDGRAIGPSPADATYEYAGRYEFRAVAPGYEPLTKKVRFRPHWYDYPGLDFVAEVLLPYRIEDVRHVRLDLEPARPVQTNVIFERADGLRAKGNSLPPQSVPDDAPGAPPPADGFGPVVPGRVVPPGVPPPFPTETESGIPGTLPPGGGPASNSPFGYGTYNR